MYPRMVGHVVLYASPTGNDVRLIHETHLQPWMACAKDGRDGLYGTAIWPHCGAAEMRIMAVTEEAPVVEGSRKNCVLTSSWMTRNAGHRGRGYPQTDR